jgi:integrase
MNAQEFLTYIAESKAKNTAKSYRNGLTHFAEWYKKSHSIETLNEILQERKDSLQSEDPQEKRRFERLIERWHRSQLENKESVNTARNRYVAVAQFFKFYDLDLNAAFIPSEVKKTKISEDDYPLTVEDVRAMFHSADLRGRAILLMAKDLGLRLNDFRWIRVDQLPDLDAEPPIPFNIETRKEHVQTKGFLSAETVKVLKAYKETLKDRQCSYCRGSGQVSAGTGKHKVCEPCNGTGKRPESPYLWSSNGTHPLDEDSFGLWLKNLARKAGVKTGNERLTFHCFRRLVMRAAIETGVGLTAAKLMVGKAMAKSDETYIAKARLDEAFKKLSKYLSVTGVEEDKKPLQEIIVQQESEIASLRKRMDVIMSQMKEYDETFGLVTKEFGNMIIVLAERLGDEATLKILQEAKKKLEVQQTKKT